MLGHANLSQASTYLDGTRVGLHASMRRSGETRRCCNVVASNTAIAHPPVRNDESGDAAKSLVSWKLEVVGAGGIEPPTPRV